MDNSYLSDKGGLFLNFVQKKLFQILRTVISEKLCWDLLSIDNEIILKKLG